MNNLFYAQNTPPRNDSEVTFSFIGCALPYMTNNIDLF